MQNKCPYPIFLRDVFKLLKSPKYKNNNLVVSCSYFEIYSGKVNRGLLNQTSLILEFIRIRSEIPLE